MKQLLNGAEDGLLVGEVARRSGLNAELIRQFEQARLIVQAARDPQGRRVFPPCAVRQAIVADKLRRAGIGPRETREILRLLERPPSNESYDVHRRAESALALRERIQLLEDVIATLEAPDGSRARKRGWEALTGTARPQPS
ncbi:MAG: MerR family transcriptional regulator [Terricaulis sp.]